MTSSRLIRIVGRIGLGLLGLLAAWVALIQSHSAWLGSRLATLDSEWHTASAPLQVDDENNLFVAIAAFSSPNQHDLTAAGQAEIARLNALRKREPDLAFPPGDDTTPVDWSAAVDWPAACQGPARDCGSWAADNPEAALALISAHRGLLDRYRLTAKRTRYVNTLSHKTDSVELHFGALLTGAKLFRVWLNAQTNTAHRAPAIAELGQHLETSRAFLAGSATLLEKLVATAHHAHLLAAAADLVAIRTAPPFAAVADLSVEERSLRPALRAELELVKILLNDTRSNTVTSTWRDHVLRFMLNEPATMRRLKTTHSAAAVLSETADPQFLAQMESLPVGDCKALEYLVDPVGCVLVSAPGPQLREYIAAVRTLDAHHRLIKAVSDLESARSREQETLWLGAMLPGIRAPMTDRSLTWDPDSRSLALDVTLPSEPRPHLIRYPMPRSD